MENLVTWGQCAMITMWHQRQVCTMDQMLESSFVAKGNILEPKPSYLYLKAQINVINVSCSD